MAVQERHHPPAPQPGEFANLFGHTHGLDCPCEPRRVVTGTQTARGRAGRHQGYTPTVHYYHNALPALKEA